GSLKQIDASNGHVYGVNDAGGIYTWNVNQWVQVPGGLTHVTVGPAGVWGVNSQNLIYRLVAGSWVQISGLLKQIDAGGPQFVSGANMNDDIYCLNKNAAITVRDGSGLPWINIPGKLKYYASGPLGCWGVNSNDDIYFRTDVVTDSCVGTQWQQIDGKLSMIEVSTDGSVYGVNSAGELYRRDGISCNSPTGTTWTKVEIPGNKLVKHVSSDLGIVWLIETDGSILKCNQ
ncbi:fish-egg lectin-like, partial [Protopterus annectens]|uniref:fish-egg lectin-like n=1 Tax=Protopterus annectens TaxID=7888 RepID=UPI001CFB415E